MTNPHAAWISWSPAELAAVILPWFGSQERDSEYLARQKIVAWLNGAKYSRWSSVQDAGRALNEPFEMPDVRAVAEAIQALEHAGLLMRTFYSDRNLLGLTRLGHHAVAANTMRQHLGLPDIPPTA